MPADPLMSDGARRERVAIRNYLRRQLKRAALPPADEVLRDALEFVGKRQERYDNRSGGLGRQIKPRRIK